MKGIEKDEWGHTCKGISPPAPPDNSLLDGMMSKGAVMTVGLNSGSTRWNSHCHVRTVEDRPVALGVAASAVAEMTHGVGSLSEATSVLEPSIKKPIQLSQRRSSVSIS